MQITRNGMTVECYGEINMESNIAIEGDYADGSELSTIHPNGAKCWTHAVEFLTKRAKDRGDTIFQLEAV